MEGALIGLVVWFVPLCRVLLAFPGETDGNRLVLMPASSLKWQPSGCNLTPLGCHFKES